MIFDHSSPPKRETGPPQTRAPDETPRQAALGHYPPGDLLSAAVLCSCDDGGSIPSAVVSV